MLFELLFDIILIMKCEQDGQIVMQFDYLLCELFGLIKMDFLGLWNFIIIFDVFDNIWINWGEEFDFEYLLFDDCGVYDLFV